MVSRDDPEADDTSDFESETDFETTEDGKCTGFKKMGFEYLYLEDPLDPQQFCSCGSCKAMMTKDESFCCKSQNYLQTGGKIFTFILHLLFWKFR